jgi:hypothetical protein
VVGDEILYAPICLPLTLFPLKLDDKTFQSWILIPFTWNQFRKKW